MSAATPTTRRPGWWRAKDAVAGTVIICVGAFALSFNALTDLARLAGIPGGQAWIWAVIVDGMIVMSTRAVLALDQGRWRIVAYPWCLLAATAGVSVVANVTHAVVAADATVAPVLVGAIAAVPPLMLLAATHLTVILVRHAHQRSQDTTTESPAAPDPEPGPEHAMMRVGSVTPPAVEHPAVEARPEEPAALPAKTATRTTPPDSPGRKPRAHPEARARALRLHDAGKTSREIAAEIGVHRSSVSRWIRDATAPAPDRDPAETTAAEQQAAETDVPTIADSEEETHA